MVVWWLGHHPGWYTCFQVMFHSGIWGIRRVSSSFRFRWVIFTTDKANNSAGPKSRLEDLCRVAFEYCHPEVIFPSSTQSFLAWDYVDIISRQVLLQSSGRHTSVHVGNVDFRSSFFSQMVLHVRGSSGQSISRRTSVGQEQYLSNGCF